MKKIINKRTIRLKIEKAKKDNWQMHINDLVDGQPLHPHITPYYQKYKLHRLVSQEKARGGFILATV